VSIQVLCAAMGAALAGAGLVGLVVRPTRRLAPLVTPYAQLARSRLGRSADMSALVGADTPATTIGRVLGPLLRSGAARLSSVIDACSDEELGRRLRQAGFGDVDAQHYRMRQLTWAVGGASAGVALGLVQPGLPRAGGVLALGGAGLFYGAIRWRTRVAKAIEARTERMRVDLYTVAQLLAIMIRTGYGPVGAIREVVSRGRGPVIEELEEALRWVAGGRPEPEALERLAIETPEPLAARLYRVLAAGIQAGGDLAESLRAVADDLRAERREEVDRKATVRQLRMMLTTVVFMAPVVFVFLVPPLRSIVFGEG
jgi:tight adherence protein C